jgi:hypothetical protein
VKALAKTKQSTGSKGHILAKYDTTAGSSKLMKSRQDEWQTAGPDLPCKCQCKGTTDASVTAQGVLTMAR